MSDLSQEILDYLRRTGRSEVHRTSSGSIKQPMSRQEKMDMVAFALSSIPGAGDVSGVAADVNRFATDPESRTLGNYGLAALGALPFVPSGLGTVKKITQLGKPAWHGSPTDFNQFSNRFIGSGAGDQYPASGHHFTTNKEEARQFRNLRDPNIKGGSIDWSDPKHVVAMEVDEMGRDAYRKDLTDYIEMYEGTPSMADEVEKSKDRLKILDNNDYFNPRTGSMYRVNLRTQDEDLINFDVNFGSQNDKVKKALLALDPNLKPDDNISSIIDDLGKKTSPGKVSSALNKSGVKGMRYTNMNERGWDVGTPDTNYVIFDPKTISIIKKYGLGGLVAGGAANAVLEEPEGLL